MAVTALEMEKHRRQTEQRNLMIRLENINTRLRSLDAEIATILNRVGAPRQPGGKPDAGARAPSPPAKGFKLKY
ncbi:MAG: hypothetical protein WD645_00885 [Dehalococcoidia bacterium]